MAAKPAYDRATYRTDVRALSARGWTKKRIARHLGMSEATLYRILAEDQGKAQTRP